VKRDWLTRLIVVAGIAMAIAGNPRLSLGQDGQPATGFWAGTCDAFQRGWNKITGAFSPSPAPKRADDATSLSTKVSSTPELWLAAAQLHEQAGRIDQAEKAYLEAIRLNPKHLGVLLAHARFRDRQNRGDEALWMYRELAHDFPKEASVFNDMGLHYAQRGKVAEAIAAFNRAIELQPKKPLYRNNMAALLVQNNQSAVAMQHLRAVYGEADACYAMGFLFQSRGQTEVAARYFSRALEINPQMVAARTWLAHLSKPSGNMPGNPSQTARAEREAVVVGYDAPATPSPGPAVGNGETPRGPDLSGGWRRGPWPEAAGDRPMPNSYERKNSLSEDTGTSEATDSLPPLPRMRHLPPVEP
jgi:Flp pilus assembly protein TadD